MATDVDVQYFSHLNGLTLGNNWGDLIRLLDTCLVSGLPLTSITSASIDAQGDITLNLYAAHNCMLFQIVELTGFAPTSLNQKYRIKGVPNTTQLILKPALDIVERSITSIGAGKLASLGYEIIFRDVGDVKRVYRAKNPTAQHPFIRVDESLASDTGSYTSTYAKYAMVGLLEYMEHIDDYENPEILQLPFAPANPTKNWEITGTGSTVVRGWSKWYWAGSSLENSMPTTGLRYFTLCGDSDAFYLLNSLGGNADRSYKFLNGCGLFNNALKIDIIPNWFLITALTENRASSSYVNVPDRGGSFSGSFPLLNTRESSVFYAPRYVEVGALASHAKAYPITPDYSSGYSNIYSRSQLGALEIPFSDDSSYLRGSLMHVLYAGNNKSGLVETTGLLQDDSMYIWDSAARSGINMQSIGGLYFYLGEL